jgi:hypothetical protein
VDLTQYNLTFKIENLGGGVPPNERDFPADKTEGELKQSEIEFTPIANNENRKQLAGSGGQNPVIAGCRHAIPPVSYRVHIKKSGDVKDMVTATIAQDLKDRLRQEYVDCAMVRGGEFNAAGHLPARVDIKVPESIPNPNFSSGGQPFWFHSRELAGVNPNPDPGSQPTIATANHAHGAGEHPHYFSPMPQDGEYLGLAWDNGFREVTRAMRTATNFPLSFNCGYRSPTHNNCVGGARFSRHLWGRAADLAPALQGQHGSTWVQRILVLYNASRDAGYQTILEYGGTPLLRFVPTAWAIPAAGAHVAWTSGTQHGTVELRDIAQPHDAFPEAFVQVTGGPPPENAEADIDGERIRFRQGGWELRFNGNWIDVHQQLLHATHVHVARQ